MLVLLRDSPAELKLLQASDQQAALAASVETDLEELRKIIAD